MTNYVFAYYGGKMPESPEEGAKHMAKLGAWVGGLGVCGQCSPDCSPEPLPADMPR